MISLGACYLPARRVTAQSLYAVTSLFSWTNSECSNVHRASGNLSTCIFHVLGVTTTGITCVGLYVTQSHSTGSSIWQTHGRRLLALLSASSPGSQTDPSSMVSKVTFLVAHRPKCTTLRAYAYPSIPNPVSGVNTLIFPARGST